MILVHSNHQNGRKNSMETDKPNAIQCNPMQEKEKEKEKNEMKI